MPTPNRKKSKFGDKKFGDKKRTELHEAVCAECGKSCEVPFKPNGKKPILCNHCFKKNDSYESRDSRRPAYNKSARPDDSPRNSNKKDLEEINKKLDRILKMLKS